jgi:hypothetical protein
MEYRKKMIPNRTIGLQKAIIEDGFSEQTCLECKGTGIRTFSVPATSFRNLKAKLDNVCVENDCNFCDHGVVRNKIRIIKKNRVTAII